MTAAQEETRRVALKRDWDCECLVTGPRGQIVIKTGIAHAYLDLDDDRQERFKRSMEGWCEGRGVTAEMFNANEGRSPRNTMLQAFKIKAYRLYGFIRTLDGVKSFVIVDFDPAKKDDAAKKRVLKRARLRVDDFNKGK